MGSLKKRLNMNVSEKFNLRWNDFENNVTESFATLREEADFFDVTLVTEDLVHLFAHKVVLSSCSSVFKQLIKSSNHPHPVLFLRGVKSKALEYTLDFIYSGHVEIFQNHLNDFLELGQDLKLKGIINDIMDEKKDDDRKIIESANENNSEPVFEKILKPFEHDTTEFSVVGNMDNKDDDFETTINGMIEKVGTMWYCKVCGKEYIPRNKTSLKCHVESNHVTGFKHPCKICQKIFSTARSLSQHNLRIHRTASN